MGEPLTGIILKSQRNPLAGIKRRIRGITRGYLERMREHLAKGCDQYGQYNHREQSSFRSWGESEAAEYTTREWGCKERRENCYLREGEGIFKQRCPHYQK